MSFNVTGTRERGQRLQQLLFVEVTEKLFYVKNLLDFCYKIAIKHEKQCVI